MPLALPAPLHRTIYRRSSSQALPVCSRVACRCLPTTARLLLVAIKLVLEVIMTMPEGELF